MRFVFDSHLLHEHGEVGRWRNARPILRVSDAVVTKKKKNQSEEPPKKVKRERFR